MATWITYSSGNDTISLVSLLGGSQPKSSNTFYLDGLAGNDTLDFVIGDQYASKFVSTNFTIGAVDASGVITVTGASSGGRDHFTFYLKSVDSIKFNNTTVPLSYGTTTPVTPTPVTPTPVTPTPVTPTPVTPTPVTPTDTTPPTVSVYSPTLGATGIAVGSDIVLTFSEAVQKGSGAIELHSGSASGALVASYDVASSSNITVSGSILTINPTSDLTIGTHYFVKLAAGSIKDLAGNSYAGTTAYDFTTIATTPVNDTTPPTVSSFNPVVGATGINVSNDIILTFSEPIQRGSGAIELHSGSVSGALVASYDAATSLNLGVSGNTLTINPTNDLVNGTHYYLTVATGTIKDIAGNSYAGTTAYDFSTTATTTATDTTPPTVVTFSPANSASGVSVSSDLVLTFNEAVQKGTGAIAIHSGSSTGPVVATSDDPTTETIGISGSTVTIHHVNNLAYSTHYYVTFGQAAINDLAGNHFDGTLPYDFITDSAPIATTVQLPTVASGGGSSDTAPALVGVGILGVLSWVLF